MRLGTATGGAVRPGTVTNGEMTRPIRLRAADLHMPSIGADEHDEVIHRRCDRSATIHLRPPPWIGLRWSRKNCACPYAFLPISCDASSAGACHRTRGSMPRRSPRAARAPRAYGARSPRRRGGRRGPRSSRARGRRPRWSAPPPRTCSAVTARCGANRVRPGSSLTCHSACGPSRRYGGAGARITTAGQAKRPQRLRVEVVLDPGPDLFSQGPTSRVSSALVGLTAVFGMGTGVTPPLQGPRMQLYQAG